MAYNVFDIANKLLSRASNSPVKELMSNMKLQKMLYYQQGFHLAFFGTPLFDAEIEAWMYGPVVPEVYAHFKQYEGGGITPESEEIILLEEEEIAFSEVFDMYSEYSAIGLMHLTHTESPWLNACPPGKGKIISKESLKEYFDTRLE